MLSAPKVVTRSKFELLQMAVTVAPKYLASCMAAVPTDPEAPYISTRCPFYLSFSKEVQC